MLRRNLLRIAKYLIIGVVGLYAADWGVFEIRNFRGAGMGSVVVEQFLQIPLKGNKLEYDYTGTVNQSCSRSLFPQYASSIWNTPCWWLERHKTQWEKTENVGEKKALAGVRTRQTRVFAPRVAHAFLRAASPLVATHGGSKDSLPTVH